MVNAAGGHVPATARASFHTEEDVPLIRAAPRGHPLPTVAPRALASLRPTAWSTDPPARTNLPLSRAVSFSTIFPRATCHNSCVARPSPCDIYRPPALPWTAACGRALGGTTGSACGLREGEGKTKITPRPSYANVHHTTVYRIAGCPRRGCEIGNGTETRRSSSVRVYRNRVVSRAVCWQSCWTCVRTMLWKRPADNGFRGISRTALMMRFIKIYLCVDRYVVNVVRLTYVTRVCSMYIFES